MNTSPIYPRTLGLLVSIHWQPVGVRPQIRVEDEAPPLADEQQGGITPARVDEIAHVLRDLGWSA